MTGQPEGRPLPMLRIADHYDAELSRHNERLGRSMPCPVIYLRKK